MTVSRKKSNSMLKIILKLAIPAVITQIINTIYAIVDRIFIGKIPFIGSDALSGIGVCFPILILISSFSQLLAVGASTIVSMHLGDENKDKAEEAFGNTLFLSAITAALLLISLELFMNPILMFFGASSNTVIYANRYLNIYLTGIFFQILIQVLSSLLICQGFAKESMFACIASALSNIVLDYIFIIIFKLGIGGASSVSVISQLIGVVLLALFIAKPDKSEKLKIRAKYFKLNTSISKRIFLYGLSSFTMSFTEAAVQAVYNRSLQLYGSDIYIAAMAIMQSLMQLIFVFSGGLTQAVQPTISYHYGANDRNGVNSAYKIGITSHLAVSAVGSLLLILTRGFTVQIFTTDTAVADIVNHYFPIYLIGWILFGIQSGAQCFFVGMGKTGYSMLLAIFRKVILLIPLMLILPAIMGITGIFTAEAVSDIISVTLSGCLLLTTKKKILKSVTAQNTV